MLRTEYFSKTVELYKAGERAREQFKTPVKPETDETINDLVTTDRQSFTREDELTDGQAERLNC